MLLSTTPRLLLTVFLVLSWLTGSVRSVEAAEFSFGDWFKKTFTNESTVENINAGGSGNAALQTHGQAVYSNQLSNFVISSVGMAAIPKDGSVPQAVMDEIEEQIGYGVLGDINKGIVAMYTPPASTQTYVADLMKSANIIPAAQAQGLGFSALDPILETWKAFRNLAYLFFVVAFLVIGFMIMFRTKVGQAAITAQQAIPSVVIAMLAVTFSYAIAGFMIDIMYVVMYMLAGFFTEGPDIVTRNMFGLVGLMFRGTTGSTQNAIEQFMEDALNIGLVGEAIAWMSSLLGTVIIGIAILFATFKVFFELVKTYVAVLIQIIFSPIILMFGAFPGKNVFGKWIKDLSGNLILWPVVLLCVLVQRMLTAPIRSLQGTGQTLDSAFGGGFMPPFLVGQGQGSIVPVILGIGVLLVIPEIMQQVKKAWGVEEGIFPQLAKDAFSNIKNDSSSAITTSIPLAMGARRGIPELKASYDAYKDFYQGDAKTSDALKFAITGGQLGDESRPGPTMKGFSGAFSGGFEEGQKVNTKIKEVTSGEFLRTNPMKDAFMSSQPSNSQNQGPKPPKANAISEGADEE